MFSRLQTFAPAIALFAGTMSLFNVVSARGFDRGFYPMVGFFSFLFMLLVFAVLGLALYYLIQKVRPPRTPLISGASTTSAHTDSALDILRERLARGEIEVEDYEARKRVLLNQS